MIETEAFFEGCGKAVPDFRLDGRVVQKRQGGQPPERNTGRAVAPHYHVIGAVFRRTTQVRPVAVIFGKKTAFVLDCRKSCLPVKFFAGNRSQAEKAVSYPGGTVREPG